jgi:hypothetical protein
MAASQPPVGVDRQGLGEVLTAARLWLREEHGDSRPEEVVDAPAARLFDALRNLADQSVGGGLEERPAHRWVLVDDADEDETEFCSQCGAQRNRHGAIGERATITGGWPSTIDCDLLAAIDDPDAAFAKLPQAEQDAYNASRDSILRARGYSVPGSQPVVDPLAEEA